VSSLRITHTHTHTHNPPTRFCYARATLHLRLLLVRLLRTLNVNAFTISFMVNSIYYKQRNMYNSLYELSCLCKMLSAVLFTIHTHAKHEARLTQLWRVNKWNLWPSKFSLSRLESSVCSLAYVLHVCVYNGDINIFVNSSKSRKICKLSWHNSSMLMSFRWVCERWKLSKKQSRSRTIKKNFPIKQLT